MAESIGPNTARHTQLLSVTRWTSRVILPLIDCPTPHGAEALPPMQSDQRSTALPTGPSSASSSGSFPASSCGPAANPRQPVLLMVPLRQTTSRVLQALRSTGFETRILDSVPEVLDAARAHTLAAIVLDVTLAGPGHRNFLDTLRRVAPQLPAIALTSRDHREQTVTLL